MRRWIYTLASLTLVGGIVQAQETRGTVAIAPGWVQDVGKNSERNAVATFVKADELGELGNGNIIMNEIELDAETATLKEIMAFDERMMQLNKKENEVQIKSVEKMVLKDHKTVAEVKHVIGAADAQYQAIAYIPEKGKVVTLTLSTYSDLFFKEHINDFNKMVQSYHKENTIMPSITKTEIE